MSPKFFHFEKIEKISILKKFLMRQKILASMLCGNIQKTEKDNYKMEAILMFLFKFKRLMRVRKVLKHFI